MNELTAEQENALYEHINNQDVAFCRVCGAPLSEVLDDEMCSDCADN